LRAVALVSKLKLACFAFCTSNGVKRELERQNISIGKEMTVTFVKIDEMVSISKLLGLFQRLIGRAMHSAPWME
jgi:hypothetical protein